MNKSPERKENRTNKKDKGTAKEEVKKENEINSPKADKEKHDKPKGSFLFKISEKTFTKTSS